LADTGKSVAIIEKDKLGGTCLNRGCIPSKMFIHPADVMQEIRESKLYNISV
jgi:dihydrolipoamide dehydrogenase